MPSPTEPMTEEQRCWVALAALGRKGRERADILRAGGARAVLLRTAGREALDTLWDEVKAGEAKS